MEAGLVEQLPTEILLQVLSCVHPWQLHRMTPPKQDGGKRGGPSVEAITSAAGMPLYALEADAFARAVLDGQDVFMPAADSRSNAAVVDELRRQVGVRW